MTQVLGIAVVDATILAYSSTLRERLCAKLPHRLLSSTNAHTPQHFLYFFPDPQGQGSFRPTFGVSLTIVLTLAASSPAADAPWFGPVNESAEGLRGGRLR